MAPLNVATLEARLTASTGDFDRRIQASEQHLESFRRTADQAGSASATLGRHFDATSSVSHRLGAALSQVGLMAASAFAAFAGYRVIAMVRESMIGLNSQLEQASIGFTQMLGSSERAGQFLLELREFAVKTPFEFPQLVEAAKRMMAFGFRADEVLPTLRAIGDAVSGIGGSTEMIDRIVRAFGQMRAKGRVSAEEMLQLAEANVPAWRYLAETLGTDIPTAMKAAERNAIDVEQAISGIIAGMSRDFGGMMEAQSRTWQGAMSNVKDAASMALAEGFKPLFEVGTEGLLRMASILGSDKMKGALEIIKEEMSAIAEHVRPVVERLLDRLEHWDPRETIEHLRDMLSATSDLTPAVSAAAGAFLSMTRGVGAVPGVMIGLLASTREGREALREIGAAMLDVATDIGPDLAKILSDISPLVVTLARVLAELIERFASLPQPVQMALLAGYAFHKLLPSLTTSLVGLPGPLSHAASGFAAMGGAASTALPAVTRLGNAVAMVLQGAGIGGAVGVMAQMAGLAPEGTAPALGSTIGGAVGGGIGFALAGPVGGMAGGMLGGLAGTLVGGLFVDEDAARIRELRDELASLIAAGHAQEAARQMREIGESGRLARDQLDELTRKVREGKAGLEGNVEASLAYEVRMKAISEAASLVDDAFEKLLATSPELAIQFAIASDKTNMTGAALARVADDLVKYSEKQDAASMAAINAAFSSNNLMLTVSAVGNAFNNLLPTLVAYEMGNATARQRVQDLEQRISGLRQVLLDQGATAEQVDVIMGNLGQQFLQVAEKADVGAQKAEWLRQKLLGLTEQPWRVWIEARTRFITAVMAKEFADSFGEGVGIPGMQHGGFVRRGSPVIVGEAGPELFVPWSSGMILPHQAAAAAAGPQAVVVEVVLDGRVIGRAAVDFINGMARRGGGPLLASAVS